MIAIILQMTGILTSDLTTEINSGSKVNTFGTACIFNSIASAPGVGAFADAAAKLRAGGLDGFVREQAASGKPLLGICLGMQLLFEKSYEFGEHQGLGLIPGEIVPMQGTIPADLKIPQIGWNRLRLKGESPLFQHIQDGDYVYFVHSYYASGCDPYVIATTDYGIEMTAAAAHGNVYGCQFHPEKSGPVGLKILAAFCGTEAVQ